jgi:hypothetical protein
MRQPSSLPCQPTIAGQFLGNGGKIEPYTIIIMTWRIISKQNLLRHLGWEEEAPFQRNEATMSADDSGPVIGKWR